MTTYEVTSDIEIAAMTTLGFRCNCVQVSQTNTVLSYIHIVLLSDHTYIFNERRNKFPLLFTPAAFYTLLLILTNILWAALYTVMFTLLLILFPTK